ncbi:hypothetical protein PMAYCL1PPCAC_17219, partial [Pristionchus mayeri]
IDTLLDFLVRYPVLPILFFVLCTICSIPIVILLIATQGIPLHPNCRYLISFWCISLLGVLSNTITLYAEMLFYDKGFAPLGIIDPPMRPYFLAIHSVLYASSSCFEMLLAVDCILSTQQPHVYHLSGVKYSTLVPLTIFVYIIGFFIGYVIYLSGYHVFGLMIYNAIDLSTLMVNSFGIFYCKKQYESLYGKASLNARYQVNEAYEMARAMHPVYFGSFLLKVLGMMIAYTYVLMMDHFDGPIYALLDAGYFTAHSFNCAFSSSFLIFLHKPICKSVKDLFGSKTMQEAPIVTVESNTSETTQKYFSMLE